MTIYQYAAKFVELSHFAKYLIPDEEKKTWKFEEGLNQKIYARVMGFWTQKFLALVDKTTVLEQSLKMSADIQD